MTKRWQSRNRYVDGLADAILRILTSYEEYNLTLPNQKMIGP